MDPQSQSSPQPSYTILRIKRKRNEEPLDALVVDTRTRKKKLRSALSMFRFAETVEHDAWDDQRQKKELEDRIISSLAREKSSAIPGQTSPLATTFPPVPTSSRLPRVPTAVESGRQFVVVPKEDSGNHKRRYPIAPPKVLSSKYLEKPRFTMYDAIPSTSSAPVASAQEDQEMQKFQSMLQDYLKVNDIDLSPATQQLTAEKDDDYVWDVFYRPPTTFETLFAPDGTNIGTVTGLPPSADDSDDDDTDSEYEDEADEDSNAEDWHTNDYPEEEDPSSDGSEGSDIFHEASENES